MEKQHTFDVFAVAQQPLSQLMMSTAFIGIDSEEFDGLCYEDHRVTMIILPTGVFFDFTTV
jgi:hypothetical protein